MAAICTPRRGIAVWVYQVAILLFMATSFPLAALYTRSMKLSPELRARAEAVEKHPNYQGEDLSKRVIIAIEAPFGTGKSTVSDKCIEMLARIGISAGVIGTETTREHRDNDPATYVTELNPEDLIEKGEAGQLINLTPFPTGHLYGTSARSIPNDVNIGPMLPAALQKFKDAGCGAVHAFYLTTTPEQWQKQLDKDQRLARPDAPFRVSEAIKSLEYALDRFENPGKDDIRLTFVNNDGDRSIEELAGTILYRAGYEEFKEHYKYIPQYVREMYNHAMLLEREIEAA